MEKVARVSSFLNRYIELCAMPIISNALHVLKYCASIGLSDLALTSPAPSWQAMRVPWPGFSSAAGSGGPITKGRDALERPYGHLANPARCLPDWSNVSAPCRAMTTHRASPRAGRRYLVSGWVGSTDRGFSLIAN